MTMRLKTISRIYYFFLLCWIAYRWSSGVMIHHLDHSPIPFVSFDNTYWFWVGSGFFACVVNSCWLSFTLDIALVVCTFLSLTSSKRRWSRYLVPILLTINMFCFNTSAGHHFHGTIAWIVTSIPLIFIYRPGSMTWFSLARYYYLFIFVSAALWKTLRGRLSDDGHFSRLIQSQRVSEFADGVNGVSEKIGWYLIHHSGSADTLFMLSVVAQFTFAIGFLTRRFDTLLIVISLMFHTLNYLILGVFSMEMLILNLLLIRPKDQPLR